jgi:hypothetical protein
VKGVPAGILRSKCCQGQKTRPDHQAGRFVLSRI